MTIGYMTRMFDKFLTKTRKQYSWGEEHMIKVHMKNFVTFLEAEEVKNKQRKTSSQK